MLRRLGMPVSGRRHGFRCVAALTGAAALGCVGARPALAQPSPLPSSDMTGDVTADARRLAGVRDLGGGRSGSGFRDARPTLGAGLNIQFATLEKIDNEAPAHTTRRLSRIDFVDPVRLRHTEYEAVQRRLLDELPRDAPLDDIVARANAILRATHVAGAPLVLAVVRAEATDAALVTVNLQTPAVSDINVNVSGAPAYLRPYITDLSDRMRATRPLTRRALEKYLLLFNRLPGCRATIDVAPGASTADPAKIAVRVECDRASAAIELDNRASRGIGREVLFNNVVVNGILTGADYLDVTFFNTFRPGSSAFVDGAYGTNLSTGGLMLKVSGFFNMIEPTPARPGGAALRINNRFLTASLAQPLVLTERHQLIVSAGVSSGRAKIEANNARIIEEDRFIAFGEAEWSFADEFGGANTITLVVNQGLNLFGASRRSDPLTTRPSEGAAFTYGAIEFERQQKLTSWAAIDAKVFLQTSTAPLFITDQCTFGGRGYGRGIDLGRLFGDRCAFGSAELQFAPPALARGDFSNKPYLYADGGAVSQLAPADPAQRPNATLASAGGGARLAFTENLSAQFEYTRGLKRDTVEAIASPNRSFYFRLKAKY